MRKLLVIAAVATGLGACDPEVVPQAAPAGIAIAPEVETFLKERYLTETGAEFFFVSADGQYATASYCPDAYDGCKGGIQGKIFSKCQRVSGTTCYVLAEGRRVRPYTLLPPTDPIARPKDGQDAPT